MHKQLSLQQGETSSRPHLHVALAQSEAEVREAQRLRYKVFVEEFGARLHTRLPEHDVDFYDAHCEHLIVRDLASGRVIGTYRTLSPEAAARVGGYYSENEFCLTRLQQGYLRSGSWICGEPAWDPDFNTADLLVMLPMARLKQRYARHFLGQAAEAQAA